MTGTRYQVTGTPLVLALVVCIIVALCRPCIPVPGPRYHTYSLAEVNTLSNTLSITMPFQTYSQNTRYVIHIFCIFRIHTKYSLCKRIREFILDADKIDGKDDCWYCFMHPVADNHIASIFSINSCPIALRRFAVDKTH